MCLKQTFEMICAQGTPKTHNRRLFQRLGQPKQRFSHTLFLGMTEEQTRGSNSSKTNNTLLNLNLIWKVRGQWRDARTDVVPLSLPSEELCSHIFNLLNLVDSKMQRYAEIQAFGNISITFSNSTIGRCFTFPRSHNQKKLVTAKLFSKVVYSLSVRRFIFRYVKVISYVIN